MSASDGNCFSQKTNVVQKMNVWNLGLKIQNFRPKQAYEKIITEPNHIFI